jgi:L-amino acid N-acyltransferase
MRVIQCSHERHASAILDIFNEVIANSTALYDYQARTAQSMVDWFNAKHSGRYPVVGVESSTGELLGFASYGVFRAWPAYKYSVEHSIHVHAAHRGRGVGKLLLAEIIECAKRQDYHVLVGGIDIDNKVSIALHERMGFMHAGTVRQAGFKFGRWLDLGLYQLILHTPRSPVDG